MGALLHVSWSCCACKGGSVGVCENMSFCRARGIWRGGEWDVIADTAGYAAGDVEWYGSRLSSRIQIGRDRFEEINAHPSECDERVWG